MYFNYILKFFFYKNTFFKTRCFYWKNSPAGKMGSGQGTYPVQPWPHTIPIDRIVGLFKIHKRPEYIFLFASYFSHTCLTANTWSMHPLPFLNPHCSSPISHSVPALTLLISTLTYCSPTTLNTLIPLKLLHSHLSQFHSYRPSFNNNYYHKN